MKTISPIQSWINGQSVEAKIFNLYVIGGVLGVSASFYYSLLDIDLISVAQGNLTMTGEYIPPPTPAEIEQENTITP